jgi:hypothetical protein
MTLGAEIMGRLVRVTSGEPVAAIKAAKVEIKLGGAF